MTAQTTDEPDRERSELTDSVRRGDVDTTDLILDELNSAGSLSAGEIDDLVVAACEHGHLDVLDLLVSRGGCCHRRALPTALLNNHPPLALHLIRSCNVDLEEKLPHGDTPLCYSIDRELADVVIALLLKGAATWDLTESRNRKLVNLLEDNAGSIGDLVEDERTAREMLCVLGKQAYRTALSSELSTSKRKANQRAVALFRLARRFGPLLGVSKEYSEKASKEVKGIR